MKRLFSVLLVLSLGIFLVSGCQQTTTTAEPTIPADQRASAAARVVLPTPPLPTIASFMPDNRFEISHNRPVTIECTAVGSQDPEVSQRAKSREDSPSPLRPTVVPA